jgi:hypothetical protein
MKLFISISLCLMIFFSCKKAEEDIKEANEQNKKTGDSIKEANEQNKKTGDSIYDFRDSLIGRYNCIRLVNLRWFEQDSLISKIDTIDTHAKVYIQKSGDSLLHVSMVSESYEIERLGFKEYSGVSGSRNLYKLKFYSKDSIYILIEYNPNTYNTYYGKKE